MCLVICIGVTVVAVAAQLIPCDSIKLSRWMKTHLIVLMQMYPANEPLRVCAGQQSVILTLRGIGFILARLTTLLTWPVILNSAPYVVSSPTETSLVVEQQTQRGALMPQRHAMM